ncbi:PadR family transcriptional regulator [Phycicoccus sp. CSK15P-2]|uniref:PadR family transcriptional regulator n=1 Tax=Phycicoccus sp. CSK15P-2 TaxID=2807627 RepID=UPI00194E5AAC|nr:PadR family transcriptional regulator [Phycicoccus sp. CSK15P-2]MBM6402776.1 PadR family transcriptional regulator [Phycicoccus sp. CSK15P-2]
MTTGHVLLGLLTRGQQHGYDLKKAHDATFPAVRPIAPGQVYAALERAASRGWVREVAVEREGGPDRTVYALTDEGRAELDRWAVTTEPAERLVAHPLATRATVAMLAVGADAARDLLDRQRAVVADRMRELTAHKLTGGLTLAEVLATDHAIAHLDADVRWLEAAALRVADLAEELA